MQCIQYVRHTQKAMVRHKGSTFRHNNSADKIFIQFSYGSGGDSCCFIVTTGLFMKGEPRLFQQPRVAAAAVETTQYHRRKIDN